ncbi:RrF2 family transcriptional regulator [Paenibacillus abyssi]|uniref:Rrf2 family transcriptional regulator n=1 Tax=Paenibacillus abyssi TaxID=1340531 RepID=A0A917CRT1_9BACL|nr:Rrf2 family transcriptional regulator [Paenibacillus abyssi]GGF95794.1 hypothetical protein GCM10010916_11390 [Paenibacillus abyssi]
MKIDRCSGSPNHKWYGLSLQAMVVMTRSDCTCSSSEIAGLLHSEATLLRRVLAKLAKENLLETREGREGGYRLKKPADEITLADVYCALQVGDPLCNGMIDTTGFHPFGQEMKAAFADITSEIDQQIVSVLERYTIADLAERTK